VTKIEHLAQKTITQNFLLRKTKPSPLKKKKKSLSIFQMQFFLDNAKKTNSHPKLFRAKTGLVSCPKIHTFIRFDDTFTTKGWWCKQKTNPGRHTRSLRLKSKKERRSSRGEGKNTHTTLSHGKTCRVSRDKRFAIKF